MPLGDKDEENMTIVLSRANEMANRTSLDKLPNTRVSVAAEIGSIEVVELVDQFISPQDANLRC